MVQFKSNIIETDQVYVWSLESNIIQGREDLTRFWIDQYHNLVKRARHLCGGSVDKAEDLVSQATLRLLQFIETNDALPIDVGALFWRVLRNLAIDQHRTACCAATVYDHSIDLGHDADHWRLPPAAGDTHAQLVARQDLAAVHRRVERLPEEARTLFVHRFIEERSYREIAGHFHISEALARKRVQKLRALIVGPAPDVEEDAVPPSQKGAPPVYHHEAA